MKGKQLYTEYLIAGKIDTYCNTDKLNNSISLDVFGNVYCCWEDVFKESEVLCKLSEFTELCKNGLIENLKNTDVGKIYYDRLSLKKTNEGKCLKCKYLPICGGGCVKLREEKDYGSCVEIAKKKVESSINEWLYYQN